MLQVKNQNHIEDFIFFLMEKNNLNKEEATKLFNSGWDCFGEGGFTGGNYGNFSEFYSHVFSWKYGSSEEIYHKTYEFHSSIDFFRMLGYPTYTSERDLYLYEINSKTNEITIVDYGAGLAHITITLNKLLKERGVDCKLVIIDISRFMYKEFLNFIGNKHNLNIKFIDINDDNPYPKIPDFDFIHMYFLGNMVLLKKYIIKHTSFILQ